MINHMIIWVKYAIRFLSNRKSLTIIVKGNYFMEEFRDSKGRK